ncbi:MAG TPA: tetratricopeptide repeat protein [Pyrinomonadaceae bacterium]|nr:tetratricopeptide repeat protein [Pyrinomonadaceae bacterium]
MRTWLFISVIVISFLAAGLGACSRKKPVNVNTNVAAAGGHTVEENQTQARALVEEGKELYRTDQDEKAAETFEQAIKLDPDLAEAHFRLGLAYDSMGKEQEAEAAYKKAIDVYKKYVDENDNDAEAHYNMGQAYAGLHLYTEAVRKYRQATRLKDDDADMFYDLGAALTKLAQYDEAVAAFSKSLEIDPENYRAEDGLEEAREGVKRIRAGKKHQEDLFKKQQKEEELKNANGNLSQSNTSSGSSKLNSNANSKPKRKPE